MPQLTILVAGGSSPSGIAAARALGTAGHRVFTLGSDTGRIEAAAAEAGHGTTALTCDLANPQDVREIAATLRDFGVERVDGVIHMVGGWRSANGIEDQSDEDWAALEAGAITTLRNVSRAFYGQLESSPTGRFAMVSSTTAAAPTAATASYAAAKAAAEAWTLAIAEGFAHDQVGEGGTAADLRSAAVVFVVKSLVDAGMRRAHPERQYEGHTDVEELAAAVVGLFERPAASLNGQRIMLAK